MPDRSDVHFTIDATRQSDLLCAASFAIGYLDGWLKTTGVAAVPAERRDDIVSIVTRLELAREAVHATQRAAVMA